MLRPSFATLSQIFHSFKKNGTLFSNIIDAGGTVESAKWFSEYASGNVYCLGESPDKWKLLEKASLSNPRIKVFRKALTDWKIPFSEGPVQFVNLDLKGRDLYALQAMPRIMDEVYLMYLEYTFQPGLIEFLEQNGFILFEQLFIFLCPPEELPQAFECIQYGMLYNGNFASFARNKMPFDENWREELSIYKKNNSLIGLGMLCVPGSRMEFMRSCLGTTDFGESVETSLPVLNKIMEQNKYLSRLVEEISVKFQNNLKYQSFLNEICDGMHKEINRLKERNLELQNKIQSCVPVPKEIWDLIPQALLIGALETSGSLDLEGYLARYPDIYDADINPIEHYIMFGIREERIINLLKK